MAEVNPILSRITESIYMTSFTEKDRSVYLELTSDRDIQANAVKMEPPKKTNAYVEWLPSKLACDANRCAFYALRDRGDILIGAIECPTLLVPEIHRIEIGFWIAKEWRGRGIMPLALRSYGQYVFRRFNLHKVHSTVLARNSSSVRALQKAGFRQEGFLRDHYRELGRSMDVFVFGLLPADLAKAPTTKLPE